MSNKVVPTVYRGIMDSVIENVRPDFDEVGVEEAVLQELLRSWEHKVAISRVADFTTDPKMAPAAREFPPFPSPSAQHSSNSRSNASTRNSSSSNLPGTVSFPSHFVTSFPLLVANSPFSL